MNGPRITANEREKLLSMMERLPLIEVERLSGRSYHTLYKLMAADRRPVGKPCVVRAAG